MNVCRDVDTKGGSQGEVPRGSRLQAPDISRGEFTLKQAIAYFWHDAQPGIKKFLYFQIRGRWRSLYQRHEPRYMRDEGDGGERVRRMRALPREIAIPFIERVVPLAIAELTNGYLMASMRNTITPNSVGSSMVGSASDLPEDMEVNEVESDSDVE